MTEFRPEYRPPPAPFMSVEGSRKRLTDMLGESFPVTFSGFLGAPCIHTEDFWWRVHRSTEWYDKPIGNATLRHAIHASIYVCSPCFFCALGSYMAHTFHVIPEPPGIRRE